MIFGFGKQVGGQDVGHDLPHISVEFGFVRAFVIAFAVLRRDNNGGRGDRNTAFITQRDLALGIGFEEWRGARMAVFGHLLEYFVAVIQRRGHQVGGLIGRITEHDPLIARTFVLVAACIDALRDMGRLAVEVVHERQRVPVEPVLLIADFLDSPAHGRFDFFFGTGGPFAVFIDAFAADFACEHHKLRRRQRFAGDSRFGIFRQEQVDNGVRNLVRNLIRVTFGHRFGREEIIGTHGRILS